MTDLLEDLDESEIRGLVGALRSIDPGIHGVFRWRHDTGWLHEFNPWASMTPAEVVVDVLDGGVIPWMLARHCPVRKVLMHVVRHHAQLLEVIPTHLRDVWLCLEAVRQSHDNMKHVPEPIRASIRKELGI